MDTLRASSFIWRRFYSPSPSYTFPLSQAPSIRTDRLAPHQVIKARFSPLHGFRQQFLLSNAFRTVCMWLCSFVVCFFLFLLFSSVRVLVFCFFSFFHVTSPAVIPFSSFPLIQLLFFIRFLSLFCLFLTIHASAVMPFFLFPFFYLLFVFSFLFLLSFSLCSCFYCYTSFWCYICSCSLSSLSPRQGTARFPPTHTVSANSFFPFNA